MDEYDYVGRHLVQQLKTSNDSNGNPRRVWVVIRPDSGEIVKAIDEGFGGKPESVADCIELPSYNVMAIEYKQVLHDYGH